MKSKASEFITFLMEDSDSDADKLASDIQNTIKGIFPDSFVSSEFSATIHPSISIRFTLGNGKEEWNGGIIQNDPVNHSLFISGMNRDGSITGPLSFERYRGSIKVKSTNPHWAYEVIKVPFRKMTGDQVAIIKSVKRYFERLKKTLQDNRDKMTDKHLSKLGNKF